ncbi:MAG: sigma 54-interacting transcriptional regulator [Pseudomonadota bacterium]
MLSWEEYENLRVIKKLKTIISNWWNTEVIFLDERGSIRNIAKENVPIFKNKIFNMLMKSPRGFDLFQEFCREVVVGKKLSKKTHLKWDETGLPCFVSPILMEGNVSGAVIATPYFTEDTKEKDKERLYKTLRDLGYTSKDIDGGISQNQTILKEQLNYFNELVELVASEIETLQEEISSRENKISQLNKELGTRYRYENMIGKSAIMQDMYNLLDKIKHSSSTVLVQGENGTGKELIAKAIHYNSPRKDKIFVVQNCSAFNENLLESELFGHVKGSFTGAVKDKKGLFEIANGGTFFLDEIGDMSLSIQVKILRMLQEGTFIPVGSTESRKADVRIIAATNRNLKEMIAKNEFREDLYYRINVINIAVPPLRDRKEDVPLLAEYFLEKSHKETGLQKKKLSKKLLARLMEHNWPGNIRELENEIERLIVLAGDDPIIEDDLLSARIKEAGAEHSMTIMDGKDKKDFVIRYSGRLKDAIDELERDLITEGLKNNGWNKSKLAKSLGISRASLISKVEKYGLDKRKTIR